jgi:hypothetical protein
MRLMIRTLVLATVAASATAAFASDTMTVNVPFNFETHGKSFPAGRYQVEFDPTQNSLALHSKTDTRKSFMWVASPAEYTANMARLALKFDAEPDGTHALRSIRLATWETPVLDVHERHTTQSEVSIAGGK